MEGLFSPSLRSRSVYARKRGEIYGGIISLLARLKFLREFTHGNRGQGIGSRLYEARKTLVRQHNKKGIVAGGIIPDYADYKDRLTVQQYVDKVVAGELYDRTLSFQLKNGFVVRGLLEDYVEDSVSDNWGTLIFWENPDYQ